MSEIKKAASHPDVLRPSNEELVEQAYQVCLAIEKCGASTELTNAVMLASDLHTYLRKPPAMSSGSMTFGGALDALKHGYRVSREGWNGKGMWLAMSGQLGGVHVDAENLWAAPNRQFARENGGFAKVLPTITMKTADGSILMGWLASQSDMFAEDWQVLL